MRLPGGSVRLMAAASRLLAAAGRHLAALCFQSVFLCMPLYFSTCPGGFPRTSAETPSQNPLPLPQSRLGGPPGRPRLIIHAAPGWLWAAARRLLGGSWRLFVSNNFLLVPLYFSTGLGGIPRTSAEPPSRNPGPAQRGESLQRPRWPT